MTKTARALIDVAATLSVVALVIVVTGLLLWATVSINDELHELKQIVGPVVEEY
ncbi:hypothetical protein D3C87_637030 [compost metagenome]